MGNIWGTKMIFYGRNTSEQMGWKQFKIFVVSIEATRA